jgi:hypothetical protein
MFLPCPGLLLRGHFWYIQDDANFFRGLAHERARHLKAGEVKKGFYGMERQGREHQIRINIYKYIKKARRKRKSHMGGFHSRIAIKFAAVTKSNNID